MTDVTCPTACVEFNHPGMEHDQWLGGVRILATIRAYEAQEEDRKAELDDLTARLARVEAALGRWQRHRDTLTPEGTRILDDLRAALAAAPSREGECPDCGHVHTPAGCSGPPTPSDLWAGVPVAACDCDAAPSREGE